MTKDIKSAYFAGLIDGEGHIGFSSSGGTKVPMVQVKMTCEKTINAIKSHFNCGYICAQREEKEGWKPQWKWRASCVNAVKVLAEIEPFLITKKESALFVLNSPPTKAGSRLYIAP